jgi:hypothetical protein
MTAAENAAVSDAPACARAHDGVADPAVQIIPMSRTAMKMPITTVAPALIAEQARTDGHLRSFSS